MIRLARACFLVMLLVPWAVPAGAFVPPEAPVADLEIRLPESRPALFGRFVRGEEGVDSDLDLFLGRFGGSWAVQRDPVLGTPHQLLGSGIQFVNETVETEERAIRIASSFLAGQADLLRIDADRLGEPSATFALGKWAVLFPETFRGVPVFGGRAHVVFTRDGKVYAAGSDFHPGIDLDVNPALASDEAIALACLDLGYVEGRDGAREADLLIYPVRGASSIRYRLAWRVLAEMQDPLGRWESWVDAENGEIFGRRNLYEFVNVTGTVSSLVDDPSVCEASETRPVRGGTVQIIGGSSANTDGAGAFTLSNGGSDSVTVWTRFYGPQFNVDRIDAGDSQDTLRVLPGSPVSFQWDDSNSHIGERDGWHHAVIVRDFIKALDPSFTSMDYRMKVRVNRTDGYCPGNAWWDGHDMNFCMTGGAYENTATLGDVVYHEYGHGVSQFLYAGYSFDDAVSEGNSDVISMLLLRNAMLGTGFTIGSCTRGIRTSNNGMFYPTDLTGQGHHDGQLICGFFWEARSNLVTTHGVAVADSIAQHLWHFSRKAGRPADMQDQVTWTFIYDDEDGNLDNGTRNFADLELAAAVHGFAAPVVSEGVRIAHAGLPSTTDTLSARTVTAVVEGLSAGVNPSSVKLFYRVDGGAFTQVAMMPAGPPDTYECDVPAEPRNARVEYYVEAADSASHVNASPTNAPVALHRYDVAYAYDPCETLGAWTIGDSSDDATNGIWVNADPVGSDTRPEYDATPGSGVNCFVTGNAGNVNGGTTTLFSPVVDFSGKQGVVARYARWFSNDFEAVAPLVGRDDYWNVDVSNDGGESWVAVEETNVGTESWVEVEVVIDSLFAVPDLVQFRFAAADTGDPTRIHAAVDDLRFLVYHDISTAVEEGAGNGPPRSFTLAENRPNPFNPLTTIAYTIPQRGRVSLSVFDVSGRLVRTLVDSAQDPGAYQTMWDGTDGSGRSLGSGVYFYRLKSGGFSESRRMILIR